MSSEIEQGARSLEGLGEEGSNGRIQAQALPVGGIEQGDKQGDRELEASKARERRAPAGRDAHRRCRRKETSSEDGERKMRGKGAAAMTLLDECPNCLKSPQQFSHLDLSIHMSGWGWV
ncbi:hypothetical protein ACLOJK_010896 [Asimina triloba]